MSFKDPVLFIALWDEELGVKIISSRPKSPSLDLEVITTQILIAFQNFFYNEEKNIINRTFFKIPIHNIIRKARIFVDNLDKEGKIKPLLVVLLLPDYVSDEILENFDDIILNIGEEYLDLRTTSLNEYYEKICEEVILKQKVQDSDIVIEDDYSLQAALLDFKSGVELFSKQNYKESYYLLKKASVKFSSENNVKLTLESIFFLSTALSQLKKYNAALSYYEQLEKLADQLQHQKYKENSIFMQGFCAYKVQDYTAALKKFLTLESIETQFINKFQFYYLYGRLLRMMGQNQNSIIILKKALDLGDSSNQSTDVKEQRARLLLELGHVNYNTALMVLKAGRIDQDSLNSFLKETMSFYNESVKIWEELENISNLMYTHQLIGNLYEILKEFNNAIESYAIALNYAELSNDVMSRLKIFNLIVEMREKLGMHEVIIKEIDEMLAKVRPYAMLDLFTISGYHTKLGKALITTGKKKEALSELLIALNIYNKFNTPVQEGLITLQQIIDIYKEGNEEKYIQYYTDQYEELKENIETLNRQKEEQLKALEVVREFWIFTNEGVELFSHAPDSKLDPLLFGGFVSAMQSFSMELTSDELRTISIGIDKYTFYREQDSSFFIIGRTHQKTPQKSIEGILKMLFQEFWKQYKQYVEAFDGEVSHFSGFLAIIKDLGS